MQLQGVNEVKRAHPFLKKRAVAAKERERKREREKERVREREGEREREREREREGIPVAGCWGRRQNEAASKG